MKISEIRDLTQQEQETKLAEIKQEMFNLRFQHSSGQLENTSRLKSLKRDVARIKTAMTETEKNNQ
jgi:large subunit ribosomal protein L29